MAFEVASERAVCSRCGTAFGKRRGSFAACYCSQYKGTGFLNICKDCTESIYITYLKQCGDQKSAVRQMCRKLDLYWNESAYATVEKVTTERSVMSRYLTKINNKLYVGKSYDDTLMEEGVLWKFDTAASAGLTDAGEAIVSEQEAQRVKLEDIPPEVIEYWGTGYESNPEMYQLLEQRRKYWIDNLPEGVELDVGNEAVIRQISALELDINRDRAAGKNTEKSMTALSSLLNNSNLKPKQKKSEDLDAAVQNTPLGVWLYRYEKERPLPATPDELKDKYHILRYIFVWMGHLLKMLGKKNKYSDIYDEEIQKYRVERPEYDGDDDEVIGAMLSEDPGDTS